jgi:hypothetical protein
LFNGTQNFAHWALRWVTLFFSVWRSRFESSIITHAQPKAHRCIGLGHFGSNPGRPKYGAGRNAPTVCNRHNAPRRFDFHFRRGWIRAWGPSHHVAEIEA